MSEDHLARLSRDISITERLILQQRAIVSWMIAKGNDATRQMQIMQELQSRFRLLQFHFHRLQNHLDRCDPKFSYRDKDVSRLGTATTKLGASRPARASRRSAP